MAHGCNIFALFPECLDKLGIVRVAGQVDDWCMSSNIEDCFIIFCINFLQRQCRHRFGFDDRICQKRDWSSIILFIGRLTHAKRSACGIQIDEAHCDTVSVHEESLFRRRKIYVEFRRQNMVRVRCFREPVTLCDHNINPPYGLFQGLQTYCRFASECLFSGAEYEENATLSRHVKELECFTSQDIRLYICFEPDNRHPLLIQRPKGAPPQCPLLRMTMHILPVAYITRLLLWDKMRFEWTHAGNRRSRYSTWQLCHDHVQIPPRARSLIRRRDVFILWLVSYLALPFGVYHIMLPLEAKRVHSNRGRIYQRAPNNISYESMPKLHL